MKTADGGAREPEQQPLLGIAALRLETVLGLRSLSIVLSCLEECDGTSFLLSQKKYWTDTILPLLRVPPEAGSNSNSNSNTAPTTPTPTPTPDREAAVSENSNRGYSFEGEEMSRSNTKPKHRHRHRHRFSRSHNAPVIKIPDASTRLDRLNTRRWNIRQRGRRKLSKKAGGEESESSAVRNITTSLIAEGEWKETVTTEKDESIGDNSNHDNDRRRNRSLLRHRSIMDPPLLRFYAGSGETKHQSVGNENRNNGFETKRAPLFRHGTTCLASYPRSGNTLLRSLLETATGFVTASDTRPDRKLSIALAEKPPNFVGEGLAPPCSTHGGSNAPQEEPPRNQRSSSPFLPPCHEGGFLPPPPICKTHWPERIGCHSYECQRVVLLVRNPFDAVDSYWHMCLTNTHTEKVEATVTEEHRGFYEALVRHEILQVWLSFLDYYWKECSKRNVPLLLVRYEDLVRSPRDELQRILEFCCSGNNKNNDSCGGKKDDDWWKRRLEEVTREEDENDASGSSSQGENGGDHEGSFKYGYRSSASTADPSEENVPSVAIGGSAAMESSDSIASSETHKSNRAHSTRNSTHPSIGRSLRKGVFPQELLKAIHDFDDLPNLRRSGKNDEGGGWLERLGYHIYKQGFPNNLDNLPPVPVLNTTEGGGGSNSRNGGSLTINVEDVSLELRPRNSPYGRNMRRWRRKLTANDTAPFPTI